MMSAEKNLVLMQFEIFAPELWSIKWLFISYTNTFLFSSIWYDCRPNYIRISVFVAFYHASRLKAMFLGVWKSSNTGLPCVTAT